ncbi:MAG: translocation/assembly module TamB domain-containing protein [Candidatus Eisenbacteria sp.]|nr:translocation/assembly module TamB domain-containing protein [Candidatus Eisenbacteria bacterium]
MKSSFRSSMTRSRCSFGPGSGHCPNPGLALLVAMLVAGLASSASAGLPGLPVPGELPVSPGALTCIDTTLFDETIAISFCMEPGGDGPWRASIDFLATPVRTLAPLLPGAIGTLRGGTVSGRIELEGSHLREPTYDPGILISGTVCADSLWWPASRTHSEWSLLNAIFRLNVGLRGKPSSPIVEGSITGEQGAVRYLGHDLPLSIFQITFLDTTRFDPFVSLAASGSVMSNTGQRYFVQFDVAGLASQARPRLASKPALIPQDIESLMALGVPLSAFSEETLVLREGSYWAQQIFLLRALEIAAGRILGLAEERAARLLALDEVRVPTGVDPSYPSSEVEIAKHLGGRTTLSYTSPVWHSRDYKVRLDFRLSDRFSIESENNQTGEAGIDLRFKKRFR